MRLLYTLLFFSITLLSATACEREAGTKDSPAQPAAEGRMEGRDAVDDSVHVPRVADPKLKAELQRELKQIMAVRNAADRPDEIQSMIVDLQALFKVLTVTARAFDKQGQFTKEIQAEMGRFRNSDETVKDDAGRIMNGLTGVYNMYAILAKMRFVGREEQQRQIQGIHNATVSMFKPDIQAVRAAAAIAKSVYMLCTMIMRDIDSEGLYIEAFEQIEDRYKEGNKVSSMDEDRYINGVFRTFEVSQLWALWMNPAERSKISGLSGEIAGKSARAESVGEQMSVATEYLYRISLHIAAETVSLTL
ncbi:MAG: hypothetical protein M5R41_04535 [Bacteroidia bacterium]|nr:hypothetical protein [Bacteroidia bacterium]